MDTTTKNYAGEWSPFSDPLVAEPDADSPASSAPEVIFVWRGSLPWHIHADDVVTGALEHAGISPKEAAVLAARFSHRSRAGSPRCRRCRHLIEWSSLGELTSAGLVHTGLWRFRITSNQVESALNRLIETLQREPRYELAITRQPLAFNVALHEGHSVALWDFMGESKTPFNSTLIRSSEMIQTFAAHTEQLWNHSDTTRRRTEVLQLLHERISTLRNRMIL